MSDDLTPERIAILVEFADSVTAGRRLMKWLARLGALAIGLAAFAYYVLQIWRGGRG